MVSSHDKMEEKESHVRPEFQEGGPCIVVYANLTNPLMENCWQHKLWILAWRTEQVSTGTKVIDIFSFSWRENVQEKGKR